MTTQPRSRFFTLYPLKTGLCVLFMSTLLAGGTLGTASAQSAHDSEATTEDGETVVQLTEMLASPIAEERDQAFQQVTDFAYRRPEIDLSPTVPVLVDIYKNDPDKTYRLAAVAALYVIGDEIGMEEVRQRFLKEPSVIVQYVSLTALLDHYGPQVFSEDAEAAALARNVLARKQEGKRLAQRRQASPVVAKQH